MARFEHENKVRRKELKPEKNGIHLFLESGIHCAGIRNPVPGIRNPQHGIQNPRLSWIPLHRANSMRSLVFGYFRISSIDSKLRNISCIQVIKKQRHSKVLQRSIHWLG